MQLVTLNQVYFIFIPCAKQEIIFSQLSKSQKEVVKHICCCHFHFQQRPVLTIFPCEKLVRFLGRRKMPYSWTPINLLRMAKMLQLTSFKRIYFTKWRSARFIKDEGHSGGMSNSRECDDGGKQAQHVNFLRVIEITTYQFVGKIPKYNIAFSENV